jgi:hypothetical protein
VTKGKREATGDWLMVLGAPILLGSLFLTWSHQFSPAFLAQYGHTPALAGIPRDPNAWQVYSISDVLLAVLVAGLLLVALRGTRAGKIAVLLGLVVALAFVTHASSTPPTRGANIYDPALGRYAPNHPRAGSGEMFALIGLGLGTAGVLVSLTV